MTPSIVTLIKELRNRIGGGGILECKKALEEAGHDIEKAIAILRKAGVAKATKKAGRTAAEGMIFIKCSNDEKTALMLEVNCETDFVAKDNNFRNFVVNIAARGLKEQVTSTENLLALPYNHGEAKTIDQARKELVAKIGENISIRRLTFMELQEGIIGHYTHGNRIGVLVKLSIVDKILAKDLAMHIAASKPEAINPEDLPQELLNKERDIYLAQAKQRGKPEAIIEKMVIGKLQKFINEITLTKQPFIKDSEIKIETLLKKAKAEVLEFVRFALGEGIEKQKTDFAAEVMAQVEGKK